VRRIWVVTKYEMGEYGMGNETAPYFYAMAVSA